ncbi:hypothetical protein PoB_003926000 [Plakobranchus ocellatus]|uniref:Uncharacterized protein n=1 Tax=Plakobranchus ocellatus TaxID=259542 RepID=A0AAV4AZP1_9GAST|nr:hypothetical protein PoB_003926000 [Plakobranchus ocellatus]
MLNNYHYAEGRFRQLLALTPQLQLAQQSSFTQRPVMNKQNAVGMSWAVIKESAVLSSSSGKKAGHAPVTLSLSDSSFAAQLAAAL